LKTVILAGASLAGDALEAMRRLPKYFAPETMNRTHPVELAILLAVLVIEAAITLARTVLVPVVALVLVQANGRPKGPKNFVPEQSFKDGQSAAPKAPLARPATHPLAQLATELEALPAATLRAMAGTRSKRHTKAQLAGMVTACS
jgi:hypothetical protein